MSNIDMWFDVWRGLVFPFVGVHVVDSFSSSAFCGKAAHLSTVEAWPLGFVWLTGLGHVDFILVCIIFVILGSIGSWLAWSVVELVVEPIVKVVVGEFGASCVHQDWHVVLLSG